MDDRDEASNSSNSMDLNDNGIKWNSKDIDLEEHFLIDTIEDETEENDALYMMTEEAMAKQKFALRLINSIRKLPVLWKPTSRGYRNRNAVQDAWSSLSEQFEIPAEQLKEKWKLLRGRFRATHAHMIHLHVTSDKNYYPKWFAFEAMLFLKGPTNSIVIETAETNASAEEDDDSCAENGSTQVDEVDSQSFQLEFINQIKKNPVLWDRSCQIYNYKTKQIATWKKIAKRMNLTVDDLKQKWQRLRGQLRTILGKIKCQSSAGLPVSRPTWFAFEAMLFVLKNINTDEDDFDLEAEITQPNVVPAKQILPNADAMKRIVSSTDTINQTVRTPVAVKQPLAKQVSLSSMAKPNIRECKRRYIGSPMSNPSKLLRITSQSLHSTSKPASPIWPSTSSSSKEDPVIATTFQNSSKMTDNIMQAEASPYSGLLNHLNMVLSKKRDSDFNEIEGLLLNCLNEIHKFPNAEKDSTLCLPSAVVLDDSDPKDEEREDSDDPYE